MSESAEITFCCLLWAHPGQEQRLHAYEDEVLALFGDHGATVVQRALNDAGDENPVEVQILRFPTQAAVDAYLADPRRTALSTDRDRAVARTDLFRVSEPN